MGKHGIRIPQNYAPRFRDPNIGAREVNWSLCEHIDFSVKYVNGSRQPCQLFADIMLSNEDMKRRVNLLKIFLVITQYVELER